MSKKSKAIINDFHSTRVHYDSPQMKHARDFGSGWDAALVAYNLPLSIFTCHTCTEKETCIWAWDHYNTNNDCLADK